MTTKTQQHDNAAHRRPHNEKLPISKRQRSKPPSLARPLPRLTERPTILIVCEGENTEPSYFRKFRLSSATIKVIGHGNNTVTLVRQAVKLAAQRTYDQVWCVFDKDDFSPHDFNEAIRQAKAHGFGVAWSNQAFEYWLILHFADHQGGRMNRKDYHVAINNHIRHMGAAYNGKDDKQVSDNLFDLLTGIDPATQCNRTILAIKRAKRNHQQAAHLSPAEQESSTTVFHLIEEILKHT